MKKKPPAIRILRFLSGKALPMLCLLGMQSAHGMLALDDAAMSSESGAGIAFGLENFSFQMAPTSYFELTGTLPNTAADAKGWKRGDVRYYGISLTGYTPTASGGAGADWFGGGTGGCVQGADGLGCPMGTGVIRDFASVYDPFVLRVFQYKGYDYQGGYRQQSTNPAAADYMPTILEFVGPSRSDTWRWSFWGSEAVGNGKAGGANANFSTSTAAGGCLAAGNGNVGYCGLQSQTIILGKPIADPGSAAPKPTILRLMRTENTADPTLGLTYQSSLSGSFRFSVQQTTNTNGVGPAQLNRVPDFNDNEGVYFKNVDAFLPLGRLHYQAITFARADANGNFTINLTPIPNTPNIYNDFYCGALAPSTCTTTLVPIGSQTTDPALYAADGTSLGAFNMKEVAILTPNAETHGYVRWGDTSIAAPTATDATNGIYFKNGSGTVVNIGTAEIKGMLIQSLKITSLGATP